MSTAEAHIVYQYQNSNKSEESDYNETRYLLGCFFLHKFAGFHLKCPSLDWKLLHDGMLIVEC